MEKLSLNIIIGGRNYPLKVNAGEEILIQKAAEDINRAIRLLQENYAVKDMQDLLAMSSLQLLSKASSKLKPTKVVEADYSEVEIALEDIEKKLSEI
ncbi:MAG: cell division protein ZapA [Bacteroidetes bacterium]|nr:cell division protein ZapA [Bacteroidota bacterium]